MKSKRDVEKVHSATGFVASLRRLADAVEAGRPFSIQVAGERVRVPALAILSIEHERDASSEEVEFQMKWKREHKRRPGTRRALRREARPARAIPSRAASSARA